MVIAVAILLVAGLVASRVLVASRFGLVALLGLRHSLRKRHRAGAARRTFLGLHDQEFLGLHCRPHRRIRLGSQGRTGLCKPRGVVRCRPIAAVPFPTPSTLIVKLCLDARHLPTEGCRRLLHVSPGLQPQLLLPLADTDENGSRNGEQCHQQHDPQHDTNDHSVIVGLFRRT